jgi:hypothetical protein
MAFDPKPHLIRLPRKVKDRKTGHYRTVYDDYLEVKWRLVWFRERYPHGVISTEEVCVDLERGYARYRAVVEDGEGGQATGYGTETKAGFEDYVERAETRALGRALAALGIGTQFVGQDLTEGEHVVDAPVASTNWDHGPLPEKSFDDERISQPPDAGGIVGLPEVVPADAGLPCGGVAITALKPAQLAMLISKVARLVQDEGWRWVPLLHALESERQARLDRGQRRKSPPAMLDRSNTEADVPDFPPPAGEADGA